MALLSLSIATLNYFLDYQRTKADLEQKAEAYAMSMATDVRWYADVVRQTLRRTVAHLGSEADHEMPLSEALNDLPKGAAIVIYNEEGSSLDIAGRNRPPINIAHRQYFQQLKDGEEWVYSNLIDDRITGSKTFAIGLALRDGDKFKGAAVVYAPVDIFQDTWLSIGGEKANIFLVHRSGWISARLPYVDSEVYEVNISKSFVDTFTGAPTGAYWAPASPIDGVERVLGYASVANTPLIAVLGQSPEQALRSLWSRILVSVAVLVPILTLLTFASIRIRRLLAQQDETESQLRGALATNERFLLEIHHRVKNNLQSAQSLIRIFVKSPEVMAEIGPRIAAMAKVHEHIYRSERLVTAKARNYLTDIATHILLTSPVKITLKNTIPDIELPSDVAMPVGQLLNEAMINAIKYGFADRSEGTISIDLSVDQQGIAQLTIHNDGEPMTQSSEQGIGSRLMPAFAAQINGTVKTTSNADGVTVTLTFPLNGKSAKK